MSSAFATFWTIPRPCVASGASPGPRRPSALTMTRFGCTAIRRCTTRCGSMASPRRWPRRSGTRVISTGGRGYSTTGRKADDPLAGLGLPEGRLVLCQVGGGQDGGGLAEAFVRAQLPEGTNGVLLTGPYLPTEVRARIRHLAADRPRLRILEFVAEPEPADPSGRPGDRDGRLQHRLRGALLREDRADRSADPPQARAVDPCGTAAGPGTAGGAASRRSDPGRTEPMAGARPVTSSIGSLPFQLERPGELASVV